MGRQKNQAGKDAQQVRVIKDTHGNLLTSDECVCVTKTGGVL